MSAEVTDNATTTDASGGDEEEEWLYGVLAVRLLSQAQRIATLADGEDSDSDSDDDVRVTIGDIKTGAPQYTSYGVPPVNLNIKTMGSRSYGQVPARLKGVDMEAPGNINGVPVVEVDVDALEEKPWRKPGADLSDYFNYGFNEDTWKLYCEKQKRVRMGLEVSMVGSTNNSKIMVQQGRTGNEKDVSTPSVHPAKLDFSPVHNMYNMPPPVTRKSSGTIDVIGGQTATISRVEGRRRHNLEGNNIQVMSEHALSEADSPATKMPPFYSPGPPPPNMPPPPFLTPPPNVGSAPPLIPPPRSVAPAWPLMMDNTKPWDYYPRREEKRDKERERPRERPHEREREREHSPSGMSYTSDEERFRFREYQERNYGERHRERSREKEDRGHRERRHREKEEGRHKTSRSSSSRRRHESEEGDSHRRHKHKKGKRSKEGKEPSPERTGDQENQEAPE
ncbi:hypothetical protein NHX12_017621 [Muraenolepis orangiensis]|uniref:Pre-mRNA 3'-end-processing factor FIP1 n=1 Tax=Muraenolepis orangiensis TaxID=630683 RepID=A0A9Q0EVJ6_9TELE|nr:hypothetical protein NHX12_017621 [Muraenolepis orangiensis]